MNSAQQNNESIFSNYSVNKWLQVCLTWVLLSLLSACGTGNDTNSELAEGMASLTVSIPGITSSRSGQKPIVAARAGVPAEVSSILIEVFDAQDELLDSAEVVGTDGTVMLTIVAGENYLIRGSAFAGEELLFLGEATLAELKAGSSTSVNLSLLDQVQFNLSALADIEIGVGVTPVDFNLTGLKDIQINWYVNGVLGGTVESGTIDSSGQYTPPSSLPAISTITITAEPVVSPSFAQSIIFELLASNNVNNNPVANAGSNQTVPEQTLVTLNGSASNDTDGSIAAYSWTQILGTPVTLADANTVSPGFTAPTVTINTNLTFELSVTDNEGASNTDTVSITVLPVNVNPLANAGIDQTVNASVLVNLTASASSDTDGTVVGYNWIINSNDLIPTLDNANIENPSFTSPSTQYGGFVTFLLTVTDNEGATATDEVTITVNGTDQPLVSNAGLDQVVNENTQVTLDGSASNDPDNTITSYFWEELSNGGIILSDSAAQTPTFTAPDVTTATDYQFRLTVTNDNNDQAQDTVTVTVNNSVVLASKVYFAASTNFGNYNIWVTDGTEAGTQEVAAVAANNYEFSEFKTIGDFFYFKGDDGVNGKELWRTDGTLLGTEMFASAPDTAYVGTGASESGDPIAFNVLDDKLLYRAVVSSVNGSNKISEYLSLDTQSKNITTVSPSGVSSTVNNQVGIFNGFSYFYKMNSTPSISTVLYRTDGINAATVVKSFAQFDDIHDFTEVNGELFFVLGSRELWKTDGTDPGTTLIKAFTGFVGEVGNFDGQKNMVAFNNQLIFVADDGEGRELWISNGTTSGTTLIKDLDATVASTNPTEFSIVNGKLLFLSSEAGSGTDGLWETDGTPNGTQRISGLQVNGDIGFYAGGSSGVTIVIESLNLMFFTANDGVNGIELWVTDGTIAGTSMVKNINTTSDSNPALFRAGNGFLIFTAIDDDGRAKLWRTDGTDTGTTIVKDIEPNGFDNSAFFQLGG